MRECEICQMWDIKRPAAWVGQWGNGKHLLMCDGCKSQGAGRTPTFKPVPLTHGVSFNDSLVRYAESPVRKGGYNWTSRREWNRAERTHRMRTHLDRSLELAAKANIPF
jgi:hypothetical protein